LSNESDEPFERNIVKCSRLLMVRIANFHFADASSILVGNTK
jgi:hypothetical protein